MGRGSSKAGKNSNSNVIKLPGRAPGGKGNNNGWDFRGNNDRLNALSDALNSSRSARTVQSVSIGLKKLDEQISRDIKAVESGAESGDLKALMTQRRKTRQLMRKAKQKY